MTYFNGTLTVATGPALQASTGASVAAVSLGSNALPLDLIIMVCYMEGDATAVSDAGDGWVILDSGYDSVNTFGIFLAALINPYRGTAAYAGINFPSSVAYTAMTSIWRLPNMFKWDLALRAGSNNWFNDPASATALDAPAINKPYSTVIDLVGRGYNNGGTTTTVANLTNFSEQFDTGQTSPPHGIVLNRKTTIVNGFEQNGSATSALAVAKTNRAGVRGMVGIVANTTQRTRYFSSRRVGG